MSNGAAIVKARYASYENSSQTNEVIAATNSPQCSQQSQPATPGQHLFQPRNVASPTQPSSVTFRGVISNQVLTADFDYGVESSQRGEASIGKAVLLPASRPLSYNEKEDSEPDIIALKMSADKDKGQVMEAN